MYVIVDGKVYDSNKHNVAIAFHDDGQLAQGIKNLARMRDDYPNPGNPRVYMEMPDGMPAEQQQFELKKAVEAITEYVDYPFEDKPTIKG